MTATIASWITAARALALDDAAVATTTLLQAAGIEVLLIKGPLTAARLYAEAPDARNYCDVDLLVAPDRFADAQAALARGDFTPGRPGVRPSEQNEREVTWYFPGSARLAIDLHRSLAWVGDPPVLWSRLWRDRTTMVLQGTDLQVPDAAGSALIIGLHASRPGNTRKPMHDLARAATTFDDVVWRRAIDTARECDAITGLVLGLDAVPEARPLLARFDLPTTAPTAMRLHAYGTSPAGMALGRLLEVRGPQARIRHLLDRVVPSVAHMHTSWPASSSGPIGLLRAHAQRWSRLARTLPRGLAELAHARKGGSAGRDYWTVDSLIAVRAQVEARGLEQIRPIRPPNRAVTESSMETILQRQGASCLERSLVRQQFHLAKGQQRALIIGFAPSTEAFRAHAWLSGDVEDKDENYLILHRA
ncbi:nucleotidyltransferase family protein [uncultured Jatrophihabitans sp.]|uniref:nucleotidyltransferase family protein n=1 Tax=uncultured Jatrophihabitans sp. TaxID=1610747 RepID=UPI0035CC6336